MSWTHYSGLVTASFSELKVVLPFCGGVATAIIGLLGVRYSQRAPLQTTINDAFRVLIEELQSQHARDTARNAELEALVMQLRGERDQLNQVISSMRALSSPPFDGSAV